MGLVINPIAFRIGHVKAWTDAWYLHRMHYSVFVHKSLEIKVLLQYILLKCYPGQWSHWIYSHATYYYIGNKFKISLFVYDGNDSYQYLRLAKKHKFGLFKKLRFYRFWTKKQLLDLQFFFQRWYFLCQAMNLDLDNLQLDSLKWRFHKRQIRKIDGLRRKYGRFWIAREELFIWRFPINITDNGSYNKLGIPYLNLLFKLYMTPKIKRSFRSPDLSLVDSSYTVLKSYRIFYFFFSYIDKIFKYIPLYPVGLFNRLTYKMCYRFFRMYFIFKPYWVHLCKLYELILLYINVNSKIKVYILDNSHLNAAYLARYIVTCLRAKFDYRDTMIPIKKTLLKIMLSKRWRPIKDFKKKNWGIYFERYKSLLKDRIYFHLINSDFIKMYLYRLRLFNRIKRRLERRVFRKFTFFNFLKIKKNISINMDFAINQGIIKKRSIELLLKSKLNKMKFLAILKWMNLKKKYKYYFFKKKFLKGKKKLKLLKKKYWIYLKKKLFLILRIYSFEFNRFFFYKNTILSILSVPEEDNFFFFNILRSFDNKVNRVSLKFNYWMDKRIFIRERLNRKYSLDYRRAFRLKPYGKYKYTKRTLKWKAVKKWFSRKGRDEWYIGGNKQWFDLKEITLNENELDTYAIDEEVLAEVEIEDDIYTFALPINIFIYFNNDNYLLSYNILFIFIDFNKNMKLFLYNKSFFSKFFQTYKGKFIIRGYSNWFFFNFLNQYSKRFKPFIFNVELYKNYIGNILNLNDVETQFVAKKPKNRDLEETPLKNKFKRLRILEGGSRSLLYGYKFHFVGRFTRKQKAASLWFAKGANSVSSMHVDVEYGFYSLALRYSACTLKVWLYKNKGYSYKYGYRLV